MSYVPSHWLRPLKPGRPKGRHLLLYVREDDRAGVAVPAERRLWRADVHNGGWSIRTVDAYNTTDRLDSLLDQSCAAKGETTIWLLRGWTDLVLSGLAELMDAGIIAWRYCNISGNKLLIRGEWRGRKITITSIGNWTGGRWDSWGDVYRDAGVLRMLSALPDDMKGERMAGVKEELDSIAVLAAIVRTCDILMVPRVPPTSAAAGLCVWRSWLGCTVALEPEKGKAKKGARKPATSVYVAPLPNRPKKAAAAERHVVYALTSRQLRRGYLDEPIYAVDIRSAYLIGLITTPIPVLYHATLDRPSNEQASEAMCDHTGLALVRINTNERYYPCRINGRVIPCKGRFWAWLCGKELAAAYVYGHVAETWCLHAWIGAPVPRDTLALCNALNNRLDRPENCAVKKGWRAVYSSLVGRFAGWRKVWSDSRAAAGFGRWSTWMQADPRTGDIVPYRSVAGKVQMLREKSDASASVPLLFGCVTAQVRHFMQELAVVCGYDHVYNIVADSLWLSTDGWQKLQRHVSASGFPPDSLKVKAIYDRAWMTGGAVAVVERDGKRNMILPGVLDGATIDASGNVVMEHADDWSAVGEPKASSGVGRRKVRYSAAKIVDRYSDRPAVIPAGETVDIPLLDESLLQPLRGTRSAVDE